VLDKYITSVIGLVFITISQVTAASNMTRSSAIARVGRLYLLGPISKDSVRLLVAESKRFPTVTTVLHTLWWRCYIEQHNEC